MISFVLLFIAIAFNWALKEREGRPLICLLALIPTAGHYIFCDDLPAIQYYATAGVAGSITIALLEFVPRCPLVLDIQRINWIFIAINFIGLGIWAAFWEPLIYDSLIMGLVIIEWLRLMIRTKDDGRYWANDFMRSIHSNVAVNGLGDTKQ